MTTTDDDVDDDEDNDDDFVGDKDKDTSQWEECEFPY
jgi:hypothetical protein